MRPRTLTRRIIGKSAFQQLEAPGPGDHALAYRKQNVCLAGAPLFEGRWIPDAGEIIKTQN